MLRNDIYLKFYSSPLCSKKETVEKEGRRLPEERKEVNRSKHIAYGFNHLFFTENPSLTTEL